MSKNQTTATLEKIRDALLIKKAFAQGNLPPMNTIANRANRRVRRVVESKIHGLDYALSLVSEELEKLKQ